MKKFLYAIFLTILFGAVVTFLINLYIIEISKDKIYSNIKQLPPRNVAIVLGTAKYVKRGKINYYYKYRLDAVKSLYNAGKIKAVLVSGDNATIYYNEPARMRRDLIKRGIPKDKIYLDFAGFSTLDSIMRAKEIFDLKKAIIVTQRFHLERAIFIALANGMDAIGFEAKSVPNTKAAIKMEIREYLARVKAFLDVYILHTTPKFFGKFEKIIIKENEQ